MLQRIGKELLSGLTVAIVALPLAIAFGITATGTSEGALVGLYGAIFTGFFAAVFGGTPGQVTGPTGPITVVATGVIAAHGLELAFVAFAMAGAFQILFGLCRLGSFIRFIPHPVVSGFMGGIALIIILGELDQVQKSFLIVASTIALMLASARAIKAVPASLVALVAITIALPFVGTLLEDIRVGPLALNTAIDYIGRIPESIPTLQIPDLSGSLIVTLLLPALSIALLGSVDSLLTSVIMDNITGGRHRSNKELIGQGLGNIASGLFGGMAGAGATVRSVVNVRSGGRTALSAATHSVVLLTLVAGLGGVVQYIPLAVLSGILILTAVGMFDWETLRKAHVAPRGDVVVMFATMAITVLVDLTVAVAVGVVLALIVHAVQARQREVSITEDGSATYRLRGPLSFLSADRVFSSLRNGHSSLSLNLKDVYYMDMSGAKALLTFIDHSEKAGVDVGLEQVPPHVERRLIALATPAQHEKLKTIVTPT
ncbi:SulP family inorganic anion transporter [Nocardia sp. CDC159]|uniref:SulP family inorganic anion transporter n=1 Tax=Nocardia pulmonis TaxID=2951408 RepID=A0A9X2EHZ3_9NOCA|nr:MULTISPECIES: SulP family inorganic anion transporter [Nocardia]MCM6778998.1 SulP family inorganic anion transporter [Nocardia pulmonis]MCM6791906.1 SulP family inorganic anion transporter [Nocardia sp. CDC159]